MSLWGFKCSSCVHVGFFQVCQFPPNSQKHARRLMGYTKLPNSCWMCVHGALRDLSTEWCLIPRVCPPCAQCSWDTHCYGRSLIFSTTLVSLSVTSEFQIRGKFCACFTEPFVLTSCNSLGWQKKPKKPANDNTTYCPKCNLHSSFTNSKQYEWYSSAKNDIFLRASRRRRHFN